MGYSGGTESSYDRPSLSRADEDAASSPSLGVWF